MKKLASLLLWFGIAGMAVGLEARITSPAAKTRAFLSLRREWSAHWPWQFGKDFPATISPLFTPLVPIWVDVEPHVTMQLDPADLVSAVILETGAWEPDSWHAIAQHLAPGTTFVDIGAHIGYYSLKAAPVVGASGRVIAVEPNPDTLRKLRANIQASAANRVMVAPVACSDAESTLELFAAPASNTGETSLSRTNAGQEGSVARSYQVRARPLDDIVRDAAVSRVDAIKIDVEGAEFLVLKGAHETLDRYHPVVLVELIDHQLHEMGASTAGVTAYFREHGYTLRHQYATNFEFAFAGEPALVSKSN